MDKVKFVFAEAEDEGLKPGSKPRRRNWDGRCLQLSTACALGVPWEKAAKGWDPSVETEQDFNETSYTAFYSRWRAELRELGYKAIKFHPNGKNEPEGYWVAIVNGSYGTTHAVVMKGKKLHYDPSLHRIHRPHKFYEGYKLVPNGNN